MITEEQIQQEAENRSRHFENYNQEIAYCQGFEDGAEWLQEQLEPKWIPVTERLPEVGEFVLVHRIEGYLSVDQYRQLHGEVKSFIYNVTHWMPLPEPPKTV